MVLPVCCFRLFQPSVLRLSAATFDPSYSPGLTSPTSPSSVHDSIVSGILPLSSTSFFPLSFTSNILLRYTSCFNDEVGIFGFNSSRWYAIFIKPQSSGRYTYKPNDSRVLKLVYKANHFIMHAVCYSPCWSQSVGSFLLQTRWIIESNSLVLLHDLWSKSCCVKPY
jgi:hypothetical protein